jgi:hypothetical protein
MVVRHQLLTPERVPFPREFLVNFSRTSRRTPIAI